MAGRLPIPTQVLTLLLSYFALAWTPECVGFARICTFSDFRVRTSGICILWCSPGRRGRGGRSRPRNVQSLGVVDRCRVASTQTLDLLHYQPWLAGHPTPGDGQDLRWLMGRDCTPYPTRYHDYLLWTTSRTTRYPGHAGRAATMTQIWKSWGRP